MEAWFRSGLRQMAQSPSEALTDGDGDSEYNFLSRDGVNSEGLDTLCPCIMMVLQAVSVQMMSIATEEVRREDVKISALI